MNRKIKFFLFSLILAIIFNVGLFFLNAMDIAHGGRNVVFGGFLYLPGMYIARTLTAHHFIRDTQGTYLKANPAVTFLICWLISACVLIAIAKRKAKSKTD